MFRSATKEILLAEGYQASDLIDLNQCNQLLRDLFLRQGKFICLRDLKLRLWDVPGAIEEYAHELTIGERSRTDENAGTTMFKQSFEVAEALGLEADLFKFVSHLGDTSDRQMHVRTWTPVLLDLAMTPGGWTSAFLKFQRYGRVYGTATHENEGGLKVVPRYGARDNRVKIWFGDLNVFFPTINEYADLAVCNGGVYSQPADSNMSRERYEWLQILVQFIFALNHLKDGGNIVMLLNDYNDFKSVNMMMHLAAISSAGLYKPPLLHRIGNRFYALGINVHVNHPAVQTVRSYLQEALDIVRDSSIVDWQPCFVRKDVEAYLQNWGDAAIEAGEVLWETQIVVLKQLLANHGDVPTYAPDAPTDAPSSVTEPYNDAPGPVLRPHDAAASSSAAEEHESPVTWGNDSEVDIKEEPRSSIEDGEI